MEDGAGGNSDLYWHAYNLVRGARERAKAEAERNPEFADSRLAAVERNLTEDAPIDRGMEQLELEHWLLKTREYLTVDDPAVRALLGAESPEGLAKRLVETTRLYDPAVRKALWDGGLAAINASNDPMIVFLRNTDGLGDAERKVWAAEVTGPIERAQARLTQARFAIYGDSLYPDANRTLRLSFGKVEGWTRNGQTVPATTNFAGLFQRATGEDPFVLPNRWMAAKGRLNPDTVFNFSSTNDILGGNSGSPVLNAAGQIVGLAFDGNIYSNGGTYGFDPALNRSVSVTTVSITEALGVIYGRQTLVAELSRP